MIKGKIDKSEAIEVNGRIIKANMKRLGIKAADIAAHLNISPSSLSQTLKTDISLSWLKTIAEFAGCSVNDLVYEHSQEGINSRKVIGFIEIEGNIHKVSSIDELKELSEKYEEWWK